MIDIHAILDSLSERRAVFHSEKDFQHELAWQIRTSYPDAQIRLEYDYPYVSESLNLDIWIKYENIYYAIELKYKTRFLHCTFNGENFFLKKQSAEDHGRYDFIRDICRLEKVTSIHQNCIGYSIILTNEHLYWLKSKETINSYQFRIHEDRILKDNLEWLGKANTKERESPLYLNNQYKCKWANYSEFSSCKYGKFKYLCVKVDMCN
ncbi:hypothetical protein [Oceanirhabdus seepicola]|uniref:NERD domain-containing protein n=1 Tax=Oceanirhabdus seepicola TaxID=2828781 RepID=A0A9J6P4J4_9CLOT|nr:hypothetical protein [Oceanirhabdus seepicola]MCM1991156.1 hypothetical protein [Oceanirhabdus seepicola]